MSHGSELTTGPIPVGQFVNLVRNTLRNEKLFQNQVITGEITQWKQYPSGHTYFTLRDSDGQINAVIWKGRCHIDPIIEEGSVVVVIANLDLYTKAGKIQLVVNKIEPVNKLGLLEEQKKLLIETLRKEGLLDRPRMKLPMIPKHIAIITGTASAALADMNRLIENRWPRLRRTIIGVTVQGENAPNEIVRAILAAGKLSNPTIAMKLDLPPVDLIIVGRGGGAPEDLWAFNLEPVVRAIITSNIPIVSAVGHESDLLVSDLVADLRASTPSNAIERCVPEYDYQQQLAIHFSERLDEATTRLFLDWRSRLQLIQSRLLNAPLNGVYNARKKLQFLCNAMQLSIQKSLAYETTKLAVIESSLNSAHPRNVLDRGYSMITDGTGTLVSNTKDLAKGQQVILALSDGSAKATIDEIEKIGENNE
ncbi:MAG TPA: exodeoxyribonuclease VII large subunit [Candidatus Thalassarchaeaceae archaeon]|nr:MAG TPA: exodeoxyribonuclease VII large subunit [Candidatus Poseidoniales archaeon]HII49122.1 exodeoxyribonuclease VII large subunit [Candidatus Thalassarchaeaceae archaeon]